MVELDLSHNRIEEAGSLRQLTGLQQLFLTGNLLKEDGGFLALPEISHLSLGHNEIHFLSSSELSPSLVSLDVTYNDLDLTKGGATKNLIDAHRKRTRIRYVPQSDPLIEDSYLEMAIRKHRKKPWSSLSPEDLAGMKKLDVRGQPIRSLRGLEYANNLIFLNLFETRVEDLSPLAGMTKLRTLNIGGTRPVSLEPLRSCSSLQGLHMPSVRGINLEELGTLPHLEHFRLSGHEGEDLGFLSGFPNLSQLMLENVPVRDLSVLGQLPKLTKVNLNGVLAEDFSVLGGLKKLKSLNLSKTSGLREVSWLGQLPQLEILSVTRTGLKDFSFLSKLPAIREIHADKTGVVDLSPFAASRTLEVLSLVGNGITSLEGLEQCHNLRTLRGCPTGR
ncbi:hypothetical protein [Roseibacillus ishigakijimensis]|uniref:Leucine-rich repeat domain-containing protein n=1 Tax=Roseibacillus ishigakijimensis TaxID=454146 RepID=A0A934RPM2_9BACT|nr:hypothetical protein [Roseibacillus ishigakijimensis]MBK1835702.1 hypothetical protein [Roseibacillus ishigakijimensis]